MKKVLALLLAAVMIAAAGCSNGEESSAQESSVAGEASKDETSKAEESQKEESAEEEVSTAEESQAQEESQASSDSLAVGDVLKNSTWSWTIDDIMITDTVESGVMKSTADDGKVFVIVLFTAENLSSADEMLNMFYLDAYADGFQTETTYLLVDVGDYSMIGATVQPGMKTRAYISFSVPEDFQEISITYDDMTGEPFNMLVTNS